MSHNYELCDLCNNSFRDGNGCGLDEGLLCQNCYDDYKNIVNDKDSFDEFAKAYEEEHCDYCRKQVVGTIFPSHFASDRCESGRRNHCTCDICF